MRVLSAHFWHSEGWTPKNESLMEAIVKQMRTTKHPWLRACDADMSPEDFKKSLPFQSRHGISTFRSKGPNGEHFFKELTFV